jgi:hypothetical protein
LVFEQRVVAVVRARAVVVGPVAETVVVVVVRAF